ncbi:MAG: hypothetical protein WBQ85_12690 [Candidatus Sulfotelmatobacter sp.]
MGSNSGQGGAAHIQTGGRNHPAGWLGLKVTSVELAREMTLRDRR